MKIKTVTIKEEWNNLLKNIFFCEDVFFDYNYFFLYAKHYSVSFESLFGEDKNIAVFWPHLKKKIFQEKKDYYKTIAPFIYGGPLVFLKKDSDFQKSLQQFWKYYKAHAVKKNIIFERTCFHPLFQNGDFFSSFFLTEDYTDHIYVDLEEDIESLWKNIRESHKRYIKKALGKNCTVSFSLNPKEKEIDTFIDLYYHTMKRAKAMPKFFFSRNFIKDHFNLIDSVLASVKYKEKTIGGGIFIFGKETIYYHLGGSLKNKTVNASKIMLWETIKWAKKSGFKKLFLGGGRGKNDSLYHYKKGFSKNFLPQKNSMIIFNKEIYDKLKEEKENFSHEKII